jgi:transcriptional regulator with XRE-family HTH domain
MRGNIKLNAFISEFGVVVRKRRHKLRISQEEFAEKANIHRTYVSAIELGKVDIGLGVSHKIARALNTPLSTLIKETESKS